MIHQPPRPTISCVCCGTEGPSAGRGLIRACYMRCYKNGTLDQYTRDRQTAQPDGRIVECVCCGTGGPVKGRGLIYVCYQRHRWAGTLTQFPLTGPSLQESIRVAQQAQRDSYRSRLEDYAFLRANGETPERALSRIGLKVAPTNVRQYERRYAAVS